jgi:DNA repair photolyase
MDWVVERIKEGYVGVTNPFNRKQLNRVSLNPKDVKCIVWWSKDFSKWIITYNKYRDIFDSFKSHVFQFTINTPTKLERNVDASLEERFRQLEWLVNEFGKNSVNFRYDPIIFFHTIGSNEIQNNLGKFKFIIERVATSGIEEMIFSFATIYSKVKNRMKARGFIPIDPPLKKKKEILYRLLELCNEVNIKMKACCQPDLLEVENIEQAHCIDANRIERLINEKILKQKDTGQRKDCGCFKSKDIGGYTGIFRCKHNCDYCYASPAKR